MSTFNIGKTWTPRNMALPIMRYSQRNDIGAVSACNSAKKHSGPWDLRIIIARQG